MTETEAPPATGMGLGRTSLVVGGTLLGAFVVANLVYSEIPEEARISVPQSPDQVWSVLTDFASYGRWNSVMSSVTGDLIVGKQLHVTLVTPKLKFSPTVLAVEAGRELRWLGVFILGGKRLGGFYEGEHRWSLFLRPDGGTDIVQREDFRGLFTWLLNPGKDGQGAFNQSNRDLVAEVARRFPAAAAAAAAADVAVA